MNFYARRDAFHWKTLSAEPTADFSSAAGSQQKDVVVVGGGLTGLFGALELRRLGADVVLLEAGKIGSQASGRSNGQAIPHHSRHSPSEIEELFGRIRGRAYNEMVERAPRDLFSLVDRLGIKCDLQVCGWIQACHSSAAEKRSRKFYEEWSALGAKVEWLDSDEICRRTGTKSFRSGWRAQHAGYLNPYALTQGLAAFLKKSGGDIHADSPVLSVNRDAGGWIVKTPAATFKAKKVLFATNILTGHPWPSLHSAFIPVRVFQIATQPIPEHLRRVVMPGAEGISDTSRDIRAFRYDARGGLAMVGVHTLWHDAAPRGKAAVLARLRDMFPVLAHLKAADYWEGVLGVVPDRIPRLMELAPGIIFAGLYSGRGIATSSVLGPAAAKFLTGAIGESETPIPVTPLKKIFGRAIGTQVARFIHPIHRLQDRIDATF